MNRIFRALAALAVSWPTMAAAQYQATVLADAPVAYYRFEEVAGTSALDSSGNRVNDQAPPAAAALGSRQVQRPGS